MSEAAAKAAVRKTRAAELSAAAASATGKSLVIVESPAKARTIQPVLGSRYIVRASLGHVRDLPKSRLGVDPDAGFAATYTVPKEKKDVVSELKKMAAVAKDIFLATDPDREGEAISWHLVEAAAIKDRPISRVVFHEITPEAITEAFLHPRQIDMDLVNAQQARRVMDRLVGYKISPILWRKVRSGLSAGRVQSAALRMIVDREREISNFTAQEYWSIDVELAKLTAAAVTVAATRSRNRSVDSFVATLVNLAGKRSKITIGNKVEADKLSADLKTAAYTVAELAVKNSQRHPAPPFTTSTLQQEASRKLGFTAQRTMAVAQQLYEGLNIGRGGPVGLITYMRTDSVRVADTALDQSRAYVVHRFGGDFIPGRPRQYVTRTRGAQEAHEAIRPTVIARDPEAMKQFLTAEQLRLYDLIWKRMVASQMSSATMETTTVDVDGKSAQANTGYLLRVSSTRVVFPGYQALYEEGRDDEDDENTSPLPPLEKSEALNAREILPLQHFTQPPPRYTDATLIKALEANGIGRPSTYASILSTIQARDYVKKEKRAFVAQDLGMVVNDLLAEHFPEIVDLQFTAQLEDELDDIADGKREWVPVLTEFYGPFNTAVERADKLIEKVVFEPEPAGEDCPECGKPLIFKLSRFGKFIGCSGFPECRVIKRIVKTVAGVKCPKDGGDIVEKRGRGPRGRVFFGCNNYPNCDFTAWDRPIVEPCPQCGGLMVQPLRGNAKCLACGATVKLADQDQAAAEAPVPALV
ncbi:MAG: type I DNA topoisomerase [Dehalococcoidia bacterium]|nr:type I DNA topoisomerase [Dehalococcoidia bacterium]